MEPYRFMEVSMACTSVRAMEDFWIHMFDGKVLFRGLMAGQPFSRMVACGVTLVFREDPAMAIPPGPGEEIQYRNHLGIRVDDLATAIADLEAKGARFTMTPSLVREWQKKQDAGSGAYLQTTYIAPPLSRDRITSGEYRHDVAIFPGPDNLWIELNEVHEPDDARWFPA